MIKKKVISKIKGIVGKENAYSALEERICYSFDATDQKYLPDLVIFPDTPQQISEILKLAGKEQFPVIPRGAGTGFSGGSLPVRGGVVVVTVRLNQILNIDPENFTATAEPGVVTGDLQKEVEKLGLFYPPDPASLAFSTLGGNIAECAGGPRAVKYGVTKDYILGLEVVLPDGRIIKTGGKTIKGVVGYNLTGLLVGSEGTLGIITKAILKLIPLPEAKQTLLAIFPHIADATATIIKIINSGIVPATLEFMDQAAITCVEDYLHLGLPLSSEALLLIEVDGDSETISRQAAAIKDICLKSGAKEVEISKDKESEKRLWRARRSISPSLLKLNPHKINEDIAVPRNKVPDIIKKIGEIARKFDLKIVNFGHAGDGNIHTNIMINRENKEEEKRAEAAVKEIFRETLDLGGTLSGEHGIGITKAPYLKMELGELEIEMMKKLKRAFDPYNILNPGKIFGE